MFWSTKCPYFIIIIIITFPRPFYTLPWVSWYFLMVIPQEATSSNLCGQLFRSEITVLYHSPWVFLSFFLALFPSIFTNMYLFYRELSSASPKHLNLLNGGCHQCSQYPVNLSSTQDFVSVILTLQIHLIFLISVSSSLSQSSAQAAHVFLTYSNMLCTDPM